MTSSTHLNEIALDEHGFMQDYEKWTPDIAKQLAKSDDVNIQLSEAHFAIIQVLRSFYKTHQHIPSVRVLSKTIRLALGPEKSSSIYLHQLFPDKLLRKLCKVAGLPKPKHCL